jgi:hypothetical protein
VTCSHKKTSKVVAVLRAIPNPSQAAQAARALQAATNRVKKLQNRGLNPAGFFHEAAAKKNGSKGRNV